MSLLHICNYRKTLVYSKGRFPHKFKTIEAARKEAAKIRKSGFDCRAITMMTGPNEKWPEYLILIAPLLTEPGVTVKEER